MQQPTVQPYWNICRKVYLLWAAIILVGFVATQFHQLPDINNLWLILSLIGLGYMGFLSIQMQFRDIRLLYIGLLWLLTIAFGLTISFMAFVYEPLAEIAAFLGIFWMLLLGIAHIFNGAIDDFRSANDNRSPTYLLSGGMQILAGGICFIVPTLLVWQYLVAGLVGSLAMVWLIRFR